jgi:hypothetical protein
MRRPHDELLNHCLAGLAGVVAPRVLVEVGLHGPHLSRVLSAARVDLPRASSIVPPEVSVRRAVSCALVLLGGLGSIAALSPCAARAFTEPPPYVKEWAERQARETDEREERREAEQRAAKEGSGTPSQPV